MRRIFHIALGILVFATALGFALQFAGVGPEESGMARDMRRFGLPPSIWPVYFPVCGGVLLAMIAFAKRRAVAVLWRETDVGKAGAITAASLLFGPVLALMMQAIVGLRFFDIIDASAGITGLALLQSALFLIFGNYIATARRVIGGGFTTPWTRNSEHIWRKTQRFLGRGIMVVTLFSLITLYFAPAKAVIFAQIIAVLAMKAIAAAYSYILWRRENAGRAYDVN